MCFVKEGLGGEKGKEGEGKEGKGKDCTII